MILKLFLNNILSQNLHCKFIALKHMGQGKQIKIIFLFHEWIREAKPLLFFYLSIFFFSTQIIAYCEIPAGFKFSRSSTPCLLRKTLKILYATIRLWKKTKKIVGGTLNNCMYSMASIDNAGKCVIFVSILRDLVLF